MKLTLTLDGTKEAVAHLLYAGILTTDDLAALMIDTATTSEQLAAFNGACYGLLNLAKLHPDEVRLHFCELLKTAGKVAAIFPDVPVCLPVLSKKSRRGRSAGD